MKVLTNNPFLMSLVGVGWVLPQVALGSFAGVFVDRWNKRLVMIVSDFGRLILTAWVTALALMQVLNPAEIIAAVFLGNSIFAFFNPASSALMPLVVNERDLGSANGMQQVMGPFSMIVGPALAAGLIAWLGIPYAYAPNIGTFLVSIVTLALIRAKEPEKIRRPFDVGHLRAEYAEGFSALRGIRLLTVLIPSALVINFLYAPTDVYLVQFATQVLHMRQVAVAELNAAFAFGMLLGSLSFGPLSQRVQLGVILGVALLFLNLPFIVMPLIPILVIDVILMFAMGMAIGIVNTLVVTLVQLLTPQHLMGRVFGFIGTVFNAASPLGLLVGGAVATALPVRRLMMLVGAVAFLGGIWVPFLRDVREARLPTVASENSFSPDEAREDAAQ